MKRILFTDTHYGRKQNSTIWLESQMSFLDKQFIPFLESQKEPIRLIHLGDVFDIRSSINPYIAKEVRKRFIHMSEIVDEFYIIAGNHDFYNDHSDEIDSLSMVFRGIDKINLVVREPVVAGEDLLVPWYCYKDQNNIKELVKKNNIKNIYTHADIYKEDRMDLPTRIFSGHIHIPKLTDNLYNIGSCYSLDFADANQERCFYVYDDEKLQRITNKHSIRFWRIYNEDIFKPMHNTRDYYELYINQDNTQQTKYQDRITELTRRYKNFQWFPILKDVNYSEDECFDSYNIDDICESVIPDNLREKFDKIKLELNNVK